LDDQYWHFLGVIPGASPAEISAARNRLARMLHPDRGGTVEDMQRLNEAFEIVTGKRKAPSSSIFGRGSSSSSSSLDDLARILNLELTISGLQNQLENERKDHDRRMEMWFNLGCKDSDRLRKFEGLARSLAIVMLDAKQLNSKSFLKEVAEFVAEFESMNVDKIIEMERRLIDGPVKEAITKANSTDGSQAEIDRMKAAQQREQRRSNLPEVQCVAPGCANTFRPRRRNHKTCSDACRKSLSRTQPSIQ
jgi:curved DNA-binding protein CbpA